jgi:hypothetical protein
MDYPILRHQLQALSVKSDEEQFQLQINDKVKEVVEKISQRILLLAENGDRQCICKNTVYGFNIQFMKKIYNILNEHTVKYSYQTYCGPNALKKCIISDVMYELRKKFPDTTIISDPLNTYILIDWS